MCQIISVDDVPNALEELDVGELISVIGADLEASGAFNCCVYQKCMPLSGVRHMVQPHYIASVGLSSTTAQRAAALQGESNEKNARKAERSKNQNKRSSSRQRHGAKPRLQQHTSQQSKAQTASGKLSRLVPCRDESKENKAWKAERSKKRKQEERNQAEAKAHAEAASTFTLIAASTVHKVGS